MMKVCSILCLFSLLSSEAHGFISNAAFGVARSTSTSMLRAATVDSEAAIANALLMSKTHGPTSKEARLAWEDVEEMASSDNSVAFKGTMEEECSVITPEEEQACKDYNAKMDELTELLKVEMEPLRNIESLVKSLKGIKLPKPLSSTGAPRPDTKAAIGEAKVAVDKYGSDSVEAKLAWETVEEIASSDNSSVSASSLDEECLLELEEACATLHEFTKVIEGAARM